MRNAKIHPPAFIEMSKARRGQGKERPRLERQFHRFSPSERGEDEGEGFERTRLRSTLTLTLSLRKGEATQQTHGHSQISARTWAT
jgi:hypothetical protein